jgi:DNA polymerase elongation subunit (family B)
VWGYENNIKKYYYITTFSPYFYGSFVDRGVFPKEELLEKVYVKHPHDVKEERKKYLYQYSADILYHNRYLIDTYYNEKMIPEANYRLAFLDIENLTNEVTKEFPNVQKADYPITLISVKDNWTEKLYTFGWHKKESWMDFKDNIYILKSEKDFLANFIDFWKIMSFDVVTGWNIDNYDIPYLHNRLKKLGQTNVLSPIKQIEWDTYKEKFNIAGLSTVDYYKHYEKRTQGRKESYKLNNIAEEELGYGKIDYEGSLSELWENDIKKYIEYNRRDVDLVWGLEKKLQYVKLADGMRRICKIVWDDVLTPTKMYDNIILSRLKSEGKVARSKTKSEERSIKGAFVGEPEVGVHDWVADLDATSLYPSIITSLNISPECDSVFSDKGLFPKIIEDLIAKRKEYKDRYKKDGNVTDYMAQWSYKILANSMYGIMKNPGFRFHNPDNAEKITLTGQKIIKFARKKLEEKGYKSVYSDTDSCYLKLKNVSTIEEAKKECKEIQDYVNNSMSEIEKELGIPKSDLHFKQEIIARRGIFLQSSSGKATKKRYVLWVVNEEGRDVDEIKYVGMESVRSDTPRIVRHFLKDFYKKILKDRAGVGELRKMVNEFKVKLTTVPADDIGLPMSITKPLEEYGGNSVHVTGINFWNKYYYPKIKGNVQIKYYYVRGAESHVISVPDGEKFPKELQVDYPRMIERLVDLKVEKVFDILQPKVTLMDF